MLLDKATGANSIVQDKYVTVSVCKKNIEEAKSFDKILKFVEENGMIYDPS